MQRMRSKIFRSGGSQAVRIPKALRLTAGEVEIWKNGGDIVIRQIIDETDWATMFQSLDHLNADAGFPNREQPSEFERDPVLEARQA